MKNFNSLKNGQAFVYFFLFSISSLSFGQSAEKPEAVQSGDGKGTGPTLVICSVLNQTPAIGLDYTTSKYYNSAYQMIKVGVVGTDTQTTFRYLNTAINKYLGYYYQRIIILEGDYEVNGPITVKSTGNGQIPLVAATVRKVTIEGEGFGTRIINASTYTTGNIFEIGSYYNTIKNLSILSDNNNTCIALTTESSTVDASNNIFENFI